MLSPLNPFSYEAVKANPKQEPPALVANGICYEVLHSNGFMRIHTNPGRVYHHLQANYFYQLPDWKLHFSIKPVDLPKAWNIIGELFLERKCLTTMKMVVADYGVETWPENMHGREITVYIYQHKKYYEAVGLPSEPTRETQQSREFWLAFIATAESRLAQHNVKERPHPIGDKPLGRYSSLRNESFIPLKEEWNSIVPPNRRVVFNGRDYCYPPNEAGWNAAGHKNPLKRKLYAFFSQSISKKLLRNSVKPTLASIQQKFRSP
jgi:hypothetical protein